MKTKIIIISVFCMILLTETVAASSPYVKMDVYYNDKFLPGKEIAKPALKIGEPFKVKIDVTLNQTSTLFVEVCSLGGNFFEVINGPSKFEEMKYIKSLDPGKYVFEWTIIPTDEWAGGSIPLDIFYQINLPGKDEPAVNGEFTVAYCTILNEHYERKPSAPTLSETPPSSQAAKPSESTPAFTAVGTLISVALALALFRR